MARKRRRWPWVTASALGHVGVIAALLLVGPEPRRDVEPEAFPVEIAPRYLEPPKPPAPPTPEPKPAPPAPAPPKPVVVKPVKQVKVRRPKLTPPPEVETLAAAPAKATVDASIVSDAELASAARAGSGSGGGGGGAGCDMARWLQEKLRHDRGVQAAMAGAGARAIRLWNGDWVRHGGEDGEGLATVREAIMWEVAWAPEACRREPVHGLVLLSLGEGAGSPRVVLGQSSWRWSDLLFAKGESRGRG